MLQAAAVGRQLIVEFGGCDPESLADLQTVERAMLEAAEAARATVVKSFFHRFPTRDSQRGAEAPCGISGVVIIQESHLAIHTWPELGLASIDLFTSGRRADPWLALPVLERAFGARRREARELARGLP